VTWFSKSAVAEVEPPDTDQDLLARAEAEMIFANESYDSAVLALRQHNLQHAQSALAYTNADTTYVQTFCNDAMRRKLEKDVRLALDRRNKALETRGALMLRMRMIK
jgi:hypothetical protein